MNMPEHSGTGRAGEQERHWQELQSQRVLGSCGDRPPGAEATCRAAGDVQRPVLRPRSNGCSLRREGVGVSGQRQKGLGSSVSLA